MPRKNNGSNALNLTSETRRENVVQGRFGDTKAFTGHAAGNTTVLKKQERDMADPTREEIDAKIKLVGAELNNKVDKLEHTVGTFIQGISDFKADLKADKREFEASVGKEIKELKSSLDQVGIDGRKDRDQIIRWMVGIAVAIASLFLVVMDKEDAAFDRGADLAKTIYEAQPANDPEEQNDSEAGASGE